MAALITKIPLSAIYLENSAAYSFLTHGGEMNAEGDGTLHSSRRIEDFLVCNTPWEELGVRVRDIIAGGKKTE